jgi:hypothetical protein
MRSRIVRPNEMRETFGSEVRDFPYAFVMPTHAEGWESRALVPAPPSPSSPSPSPADGAGLPRRRAGDKKPTYIEIKPKS